jgi:AcrR family transcriptional regulator
MCLSGSWTACAARRAEKGTRVLRRPTKRNGSSRAAAALRDRLKSAPATRPSESPSTNGKREQNKANNRAEILAAARDVFTELGYDAATVRDIIRRTRLASGTFYNYFPDKESIFRELLHEAEQRRLEWLARTPIRSRELNAAIEEGFRAYFEFVAADRTMFDLLRRNAASIRAFAGDPVLRNELERLRQVFKVQSASGRIPRIDPDYLASAMFGIGFEVAVIMVERDPVDVDGATAFATNLFVGAFERAERLRG